MRLLLPLIVLIFANGVASADSPTVLIFGDSLSAGYGIDVDQSWVVLLQARLEETGYEHRVVNASISGETTEGGVTRIRSLLDKFAPELIVIELGANDGLRGLPTARMKANLDTIVSRARAAGAGVVLLGMRIPSNYGLKYSREFEDVYHQVSDEHGIGWIRFFMEGVAMNQKLLQDDRMHPNADAQPILLDNAWPAIIAALRK